VNNYLHDAEYVCVCVFFSRACCFFVQINMTLAYLNLSVNQLGPEGGKAIARSLEVIMMMCCFHHNAQ
jgi:hypothetical protein